MAWPGLHPQHDPRGVRRKRAVRFRKGSWRADAVHARTARLMVVGDVFDAAQNVEGGTSYFRHLLSRFDNDLALALAAYNAGPEKVVLHPGIPPYMETRAYVSRVIRLFNQSKQSR